jgi:hypothetical protein
MERKKVTTHLIHPISGNKQLACYENGEFSFFDTSKLEYKTKVSFKVPLDKAKFPTFQDKQNFLNKLK